MSEIYTYPHLPIYPGGEPHDFTEASAGGAHNRQLGVHTHETTQRYVYGTRYMTWDGKVYKYSLAGAACYTTRLNLFWNTISSDVNGIDYSLLTNAQSVGDREITLTNGTTAVAEDYLAGGLAVIIPTETVTDGQVMERGIVGNEAAAAAAECRIFLDSPLDRAVLATNYAYVMPSSYRNIRWNDDTHGRRSAAGLAAVYTASGSNFWCQTYGPCQVAANTRLGSTIYYRTGYARHNGTVDIGTQVNTSVRDQIVGFVLDNNGDDNGCTNFMLTISF